VWVFVGLVADFREVLSTFQAWSGCENSKFKLGCPDQILLQKSHFNNDLSMVRCQSFPKTDKRSDYGVARPFILSFVIWFWLMFE